MATDERSRETTKSEGPVEHFEDLIAWQKARVWVRDIYLATRSPEFARDFELRGQIRDAVVSTMANTAEGFERGRRREFHQFVSTAKASCAEARSHLYVALDVGYIDEATFKHLMGQGKEISRILGGLRASLERQLDAGAR